MRSLFLAIWFLLLFASAAAQSASRFDLVVYGGTAGGVMTAVSAARSQAGLSINMTGRPKITTTKITVTHRHMGMIVTSRQAIP